MNYAALSPVDVALACLRTGQEDAWAEFIRRFNPLISGIVIRVARKWGESSDLVLDDLIQEIYLKLCSERALILSKFNPEHPDSIFGFIKVFTANTVHDHFKTLHAQKRGSDVTTELTEELEHFVGSPDADSVEISVLLGEIDSFLERTETGPKGERDRQIFWLYYRVGLTAAAISATSGIGLNTKGVESTILRLTRRVRAHMTLTSLQRNSQTQTFPGKGIRTSDSL